MSCCAVDSFCRSTEDAGSGPPPLAQNRFASCRWTWSAPKPLVKSTTSIAEMSKGAKLLDCYDQTAQHVTPRLLRRRGPRWALLILGPTARHPFVCEMRHGGLPRRLFGALGRWLPSNIAASGPRRPPCHWMDASVTTAAAIGREAIWFWGRVGGRWP